MSKYVDNIGDMHEQKYVIAADAGKSSLISVLVYKALIW